MRRPARDRSRGRPRSVTSCPRRPRPRRPRRRGHGRARASRRHDRPARPTCSAPTSRGAGRRARIRRPRRRGARRLPTPRPGPGAARSRHGPGPAPRTAGRARARRDGPLHAVSRAGWRPRRGAPPRAARSWSTGWRRRRASEHRRRNPGSVTLGRCRRR